MKCHRHNETFATYGDCPQCLTEKRAASPASSANMPLKELIEIMARVKADAEANVLHFRTDAYEHGSITRLKKWNKRLRDIKKVLAWLDSHSK